MPTISKAENFSNYNHRESIQYFMQGINHYYHDQIMANIVPASMCLAEMTIKLYDVVDFPGGKPILRGQFVGWMNGIVNFAHEQTTPDVHCRYRFSDCDVLSTLQCVRQLIARAIHEGYLHESNEPIIISLLKDLEALAHIPLDMPAISAVLV